MACAWLMKRIVVHVANKNSIPVAASPPPVLRQRMSMRSARREGQVAASGAVARGDPPRCSGSATEVLGRREGQREVLVRYQAEGGEPRLHLQEVTGRARCIMHAEPE